MLTSKKSLQFRSGFGLVEIMVGLVIGSLAAIVMLQTFSLAEERKRTTTGGGDAQSTGAIAFYQLQRDIAQAGYGFSALELFNCGVTWALASGSNIPNPVPLAPVAINSNLVPAGDANTDTLLVMYGNTNGQPQGNSIEARAGAVYTVQMANAFAVGDRVIPGPCGANHFIDRVTATAASSVTVATGMAGTTLYNMGPSPTILAYAIRGGNLTVCDFTTNNCSNADDVDDPAVWAPLASNVVSMRARYARDLSGTMDGIPDTPYDQTTPTTGCGWARISAINLTLVARNSQYEKEAVTQNAPTWAGSAAPSGAPSNATAPIVLSGDSQWQHYRYRVFEGIVPIRNVVWMGVQTGC